MKQHWNKPIWNATPDEIRDGAFNLDATARSLANAPLIDRGDSQVYSVAQHCVLLSRLSFLIDMELAGLLFNVYRGFLVDPTTSSVYGEDVELMQLAVLEGLGVPPLTKPDSDRLSQYDQGLREAASRRLGAEYTGESVIELYELPSPLSLLELRGPYGCWSPARARREFMKQLSAVTGLRVWPSWTTIPIPFPFFSPLRIGIGHLCA